MANTVTMRVSAPGAKQAAGEFDLLANKIKGIGTTGNIGGLSKSLGALGLGAIGAGAAMGVMTDAAGQVSAFLGDSIGVASDLNETISKTKSVFGDSSDDMLDWSEDAAHSFGLAQGAALDAATTFGGMFKTVGESAEAAGAHAREMTELGADLASFFNTDMQSALDSLRSGLSGEAEPMRKFNVFLSDAAVNAKLMEMGQVKLNGAWTEGQKVQGRYAIIMEQTADAQGDFAKTQDGLANASREFDAAIMDLKADIGEDFLGAMEDGAGAAVDFTKALQGITDVIEAGFGIEQLDLSSPIIDSLADMLPGGIADVLHNLASEGRLNDAAARLGEQIGRVMVFPSEVIAGNMQDAMRGADLDSVITGVMGTAMDNSKGQLEIDSRHLGQGVSVDIMDGLVDGVHDNKGFVTDTMDDLLFAIKHPLMGAKEIARIEGALASKDLANGLNSNIQWVRDAAEQAKAALIARWESINGRPYGSKFVNTLADGIDQTSGRAENSARQVRNKVENILDNTDLNIPGFGTVSGVGGKKKKRKKRASGGPVSSGESYIVGENGPELLQMGSGSGNIVPNHRLGGGGGGPLHVHVHLSTREFRGQSTHDRVVQGGGPAF